MAEPEVRPALRPPGAQSAQRPALRPPTAPPAVQSPEAMTPFQVTADEARMLLEGRMNAGNGGAPVVSPEAQTPFQQRADAARMGLEGQMATGRPGQAPAGTISAQDLRTPTGPGTDVGAGDPDEKVGDGKPTPITGADTTRFEQGSLETLEQRAAVTQEQGNQLSETLSAIEEQIRTSDLKAAERQFHIAEAQRTRLAEMDQQISQMRETRFDASRLFAGADGATRFGAQLGIAVGHMLQVRNNILFPGSNTPNAALQIINDAIDRDIRTQVTQHQQGLSMLTQQRTAMGLAREIGFTEVTAETFARERMLESVQRQLTSLAYRHRGTQQALIFNQMANQMGLQRAELAAAVDREAQILMAMRAQQAGNSAGLGQPRNMLAPWVQVDSPEQLATLNEWIEGLPAPQRDRLMTLSQSTSSFVSGLDRLISRVERMDAIDDLSSEGADVESQASLLLMTFKEATGAGAIDEGMLGIWKQILGNPREFFSMRPYFLARARAVREWAVDNMQQSVRNLVEPGVTRAGQVPRGSLDLSDDRLDREEVEERGRIDAEAAQRSALGAVQDTVLGTLSPDNMQRNQLRLVGGPTE